MSVRDPGGGPTVLAFLQSHGPATVREISAQLFPDDAATSSSPGYMKAYNWLLSLERVSAVERTRVPSTNGSSAYDLWSAIKGATAPDVLVRARSTLAGYRKRAAEQKWRHIRVTERMWLELLGILNDAVIDAPGDIDVRKLRNIVSAARIEQRDEGRADEAVEAAQ
jgi:hypothetical protein